MADLQLQIQNLVKLANTANIELADIEITLSQASDIYKIQIREDIYSISKELQNIIHRNIERQAYYIQVLLANKLDWYKDKEDEWVEEYIKIIQDIYTKRLYNQWLLTKGNKNKM